MNYFCTTTTPKGARAEVSVKHNRNLQQFRVSIIPYMNQTMLNPFAGLCVPLAYGRANQKKLADIWSKTEAIANEISRLFWTLPADQAKQAIKKLYFFNF